VEDAPDKIRDMIIAMMFKASYWGYLFTRIHRREKDMGSFFVMGVESDKEGNVSLTYNNKKVENTDNKTLLLMLEHEGMHLLNKHLSRFFRIIANDLNNNNPEIVGYKCYVWNIAADMVVNHQMSLPKKLIVDKEDFEPYHFDSPPYTFKPGFATEYYFYQLLKNHDQKLKSQYNMIKHLMGYGSGEGELRPLTEDEKKFLKKLIDDHADWIKELKDIPDLHSYARKVEQTIVQAISEASKNIKERGLLPAHISQLIFEALLPPKAPYYQIIRKLVRATRLSKFKNCSTRINRKRTYLFAVGPEGLPELSPFPGKIRDRTFKIGVLLDTSGSMSKEDILEGLSGIKNIIENDRYCFTTVIECDAKVQKEYEVKKVRDIQFNIKGRGGTEMWPGLKRFKELSVDVTLGFTDGYTDNINEIPRKLLPKKIIWVVTPRGQVETLNKSGFIVRL
jgi:predicted metal-dependent peptidase